jgi:O-antigen/teichoic acid export membrane protein
MKIFSPAIKAASVFALGGAAFALANLLLARNLSMQDYGQFALILAILNLGIPLGPIGLDAAVLRHRPGPDKRLLGVSIVVGLSTGALMAITAKYAYSLNITVVVILGIAIMAGSIARLSASVYQSENRFSTSLWLIQSQNITLISAAMAAGLVVTITPTTVFALFTTHWALAAVVGWVSLIYFSKIETDNRWTIPWREVPALFGYIITVQLAAQLDKLMLPKVLDIESLATFGVLSALVLAPYKVFQAGVGFTLIPGLRTAETKTARTKTILHEAKTTMLVIALGIGSGFFIAPWVAQIFLAGKYELGNMLIGAAVFAGTARVMVMFVSSVVTALGSQAQLTSLNRGSWLALLLSILGGWWGAQWGLPGFIAGFALGSLFRVALASEIAAKVWRAPTLSHS